ncbi:hypothetical protein RvY_05609 [Ramazzottius varieornatus]|uniref:Uncharacterized protein n=1 Tax=Ramazzottius varieornatus TaxID=947166 RepID=A0A1D1V4M7_RAMVA|nr:hypothetical protein RvY_05609 [Ramazzottius varieornatus]
MGTFRRFAIRTRKPSQNTLQLALIVFLILFNFLFILWFTAFPALKVLWTKQSPALPQPSLWDAQQPEPGCGGEGKTRLFSTDWILKLIAKASVMLRKYRKRNLQRMEGGMSPVTPKEAELFDEIGEVMTMFNDRDRRQNLDMMSMLPRIMSLYGKLKHSAMFADTDKDNSNKEVPNGNAALQPSPNFAANPLVSLNMLK